MNIEIIKIFENLKPKWYDGELGEIPNLEILQQLEINFNKEYIPIEIIPLVYPVPEGGVEIEWHNGFDWNFSIEFNYYANEIIYCYIDKNKNQFCKVLKPVNNSKAYKYLNLMLEFIRILND